jgi:hypothetical protein
VELGVGLPTVAVHDLIIHPREGDVIAATHGRSVWILDDVTPLQQLTADVQASNVHVFNQRVATVWRGISRGATRGHKLFIGRNPLSIEQSPPGNSPNELSNSAGINFWVRAGGQVTIEISDLAGENSVTEQVLAHPGINRWFWNLRFSPSAEQLAAFEQAQAAGRGGRGGGGRGRGFGGRGGFGGPQGAEAAAGTYRVQISAGGSVSVGTIRVRDDPGIDAILPGVR